MPATIKQATLEYKKQMDTLRDSLSECCDINPKGKVASKDLYTEYKRWTEENGEETVKPNKFGLLLGKRGFNQTKFLMDSKQVRGWKGISLKELSFDFTDDGDKQE